MGISRISDLFAANIDPLSTKSKTKENAAQPDSTLKSSSEAVFFKFSGSSSPNESNNSARIAELKAQVNNKSYNPDLNRVAASILRDLA